MKEEPTRKLAVLLHADVVSSTALVQLNETLAHERIQETFRRFSQTIAAHGGIAHEIRGDALVAEFSKASDAVSASLAFQEANTDHNEELEDDVRPIVRVGIALGEVVVADNTITGEGIVLAQRLEQLAEPGGVCIQGAAHGTVPKRLPFVYENLGDHSLKGFEDPIRAYSVRGESHTATTLSETPRPDASVGYDFPDKPSIAVLPFDNMSGDQEQEFFSDGISEDITTALSRSPNLFVIARNSAFTYRGAAVDVRRVGRELGVRYVLEGSVRKAGNRVRVTAQLNECETGAHIWAERYDRSLDDVFAVQDDITFGVATAVGSQIQVTEGEQAAKRDPRDLDARQLVARANWHLDRATRENFERARELCEDAISRFPDYASSYAYLATVNMLELTLGMDTESPQNTIRESEELARRAVELDPNDDHAHSQLAMVLWLAHRFDDALNEAQAALDLNPNHAGALAIRSAVHAFSGAAERDLAIEFMTRACRASPNDPWLHWWYFWGGVAEFFYQDFEAALRWCRKSLNVCH